MGEKTSLKISVEPGMDMVDLFGAGNVNLTELEKKYCVDVSVASDGINISGDSDDAAMAANVIKTYMAILKEGKTLDETTLNYVSDIVREKGEFVGSYDQSVCHTFRGKLIKCKTFGQKEYIRAIDSNDIVFAVGPAGTGKTYLAMAMAVNAFKKGDVDRIVLVRPAVEAGESLGFLPGDLKEKVDPYLRPLYDALYDIMGLEACERNMARGAIEIAPLAYMRGRTLENSFIILDEAQNTTPEQMKMFLTRLGFGSKAVITGDITQIDLPYKEKSGLLSVENILGNVKGISFVKLTHSDVVRNPIVQRIINAYDEYEKQN